MPDKSGTAVRHPLVARLMPRFLDQAHARGQGAHRRELLSGLTGRVVEIGAGNGLNFQHYPATVTEVVAIEPEPYLRGLAEVAARRAPVHVNVLAGTAERLPAADATFDAGVASLVLCSIARPMEALSELYRVLRPGGSLRFYEHVRSKGRLAVVQRQLDHWLWPQVSGGCHCARDTLSLIRAAGFVVEDVRELVFLPSALFMHISPHVLGRAQRPLDTVP